MEKSFREKLNRLRLDILYINSYQSIVILVILAVLIAFFYRNEYGEVHYNPYVFSIWLPGTMVVFLLKFITTIAYTRKIFRQDDELFWQYVFYLTTLLTGLAIGSSIFFVSAIKNNISNAGVE